MNGAQRSEAGNQIANSTRIIAFAALAYSPASVAIGIFSMDVSFIRDLHDASLRSFCLAIAMCYMPVILWLSYLFLVNLGIPWVRHRVRPGELANAQLHKIA